MASNLFYLKGWAITLIAALFALAAKETERAYFLLAYLPALMFWGLDAYFLSQERRFRALYDRVRKLSEDDIDFSMDTTPFKKSNKWRDAFFSKTLIVYYGFLGLTMLVVMYLMRKG